MKLNIFTLATDENSGTNCRVFGTKNQRDDALLEWFGSDREDWAASQSSDDLQDYDQSRTDHPGTFAIDEQAVEIDPAGLMTLNVAWKVCKDTPGSFGNLYDPDEVLTILDGWAEEGDKDETCYWFDPDSAEDRMAILAWCEQVGPDFETRISELVCSNLPNQSEALAALDAKLQRDRVA